MQEDTTLLESFAFLGIGVFLIVAMIFVFFLLMKHTRAMFPKGGRRNAIQESLDLARESLKAQQKTNELLCEVKEELKRGRES